MKNDNHRAEVVLALCGIIPAVWLALLAAPHVNGGLWAILNGMAAAFDNPFRLHLCEDSLKTVLLFLCAYGMGIALYFSTQKNYRRREEHGSAKWGSATALNRKYRDKDPSANKILTRINRKSFFAIPPRFKYNKEK